MSPDELEATVAAANGEATRRERRARLWMAGAIVVGGGFLALMLVSLLEGQADHDRAADLSIAASDERADLVAGLASVVAEIEDCTTEGGQCYDDAQARSAELVSDVLAGIEVLLDGLDDTLAGLDGIAVNNGVLLAELASARAEASTLAEELGRTESTLSALVDELAAIRRALATGTPPPPASGVLCELLGPDLGAVVGC